MWIWFVITFLGGVVAGFALSLVLTWMAKMDLEAEVARKNYEIKFLKDELKREV